MSHQARRRIAGFVLSGAIGILMALLAGAAGTIGTLENNALDARFEIRGTPDRPPAEVAVVAIDDRTFSDLRLQWPFNRRWHARVLDRLREAGARVIAYDVQFSEPSQDVDADNRLVLAAERVPRAVFAATEVNDDGESNVFGGDGVLESRGGHAGSANFLPDAGSVLRRMPVAVDGLGSFAIEAARLFRGAKGLADPPNDRPWIDFTGPAGTVRTYSFSRVATGKFPRDAFRGRVVVVGATTPTLHDVHTVSSLRDAQMSGAELNANAVLTALHGYPLRSASGWAHGLLVIVMGALAPLAAYFLRPRHAALVGLAAVALFLVGAQIAFDRGTILPVAEPLAALALAAFGSVVVQAVTNGIERERVRRTFERFVGDNVVDDALSRADGLRLGGVETPSTILFLDVRGFTTFSEHHPASVVLEVLNRFLTLMSEAVLDAGGTLTSYLGDGLMAVFGAPIPQADHADRALAAAEEMVRRLPEFNAWLDEQGLGAPLEIGIGMHSGRVMSGMVGSERRLEYTAIGDTVNCASRLEGLTKGTGDRVFLSDDTREALLRPPRGTLVDMGDREIRGRAAPMRVWALRPAGDTRMNSLVARTSA
jgi:adenylate cyclase